MLITIHDSYSTPTVLSLEGGPQGFLLLRQQSISPILSLPLRFSRGTPSFSFLESFKFHLSPVPRVTRQSFGLPHVLFGSLQSSWDKCVLSRNGVFNS